jgi:para-nitrobenzyl esterase
MKRTNQLPLALQAGLTRRELLPAIGYGVLLAGGATSARAAVTPSPVVETACGHVRGATVRSVHIFRGIPYGGPTEGAGRFLPPSKPAKWAGVRDATETGPRCIQGEGNIFLHPIIGEYFGGGRLDRVELAKQVDSENCLVLNVLTPGLRGKRPVMLYIHGGGLASGSGLLTLYGDGLPREQDIVLVGVNHRLNVFGYTYLGGLSPKYATGNVGQLDLVAALDWVRDNIAQFGGDPGNVMIFGESGGGSKVSALLAMPAAEGLFHRASVQSGSGLRVGTAESGTESARRLLTNLGLNGTQVDELQKIPADKLFAAARGRGMGGGMVVDGHSIPQQTWDPRAPEVSASVPMLVGNDKDESTLFSVGNPALFELDDAGLRASLVKAGITETDAGPLTALYRRDHPSDSPTDLYFRISSDRGARRNAIRQAELKAEQGKANVYMWYCRWNTPLGEGKLKIKSFHTCDLPLTMRLVRYPESEQLSKQLSGAWAAFARTGNPSQKGLKWPAYTLTERATMIFDGPKSEVIKDPDRAERLMVRDRPSSGPL